MIRTINNPAASTVTETAIYFGIEVEILAQMEHCTLIHYGDLKVVVDTDDLVFARALKAVA